MTLNKRRSDRDDSLRSFKRRHILLAARRLFDAHGADGLSMRAIASEAGYSLGAAYAYFQTKEEIEIELLAAIIADLTRHIRTAAEEDSQPAVAGFRTFLRHFIDRREECRLLLATLSRPVSPPPSVARKHFESRLLVLLGLLATNLHRHSGAEATRAQAETADFFSYILGILTLHSGDALAPLGREPQEMVDRYGEQMLLRITP